MLQRSDSSVGDADQSPWYDSAVDARLAAMRSRMARQHDGRLIGRPAGEGGKYLLTGLIRCGICGGSFEALGSAFGGKRFVYGCATHRRKGAVVCPNGMTVKMADAEDAVLATVEDLILNPAVIDRALAVAEDTLRRDRTAERQTALETELAAVKHATLRLTEANATSGDLMPLVKALETQEQRRKELEARLDAIRRPHHTSDPGAVRRQPAPLPSRLARVPARECAAGTTGAASPDHRSSQLHPEREGELLRVQRNRNCATALERGQYCPS